MLKECKKLNRFKNYISKLLLSLHEWMLKRPVILTFFLSSVTILFSFILVFLGDLLPVPFKLTEFDSKSHLRLTPFGMVISSICLIWNFLLEASDKYYDYKKKEDMSNAEAINYIRERVDTRIVSVCDNKFNTLISLIDDISKGNTAPKCIISKPCEQLKSITKELDACLRSLLIHNNYDLNENEIYITIFYKFQYTGKWKQTQSAFPEIGAPIDSIVNNPNSTFYNTLKSKNGILFINDKQKGADTNKYVPDKDDKYDENGKLKGSILCYRINCTKNGVNYISAIISISTYNKRIEPNNISNQIKNIEDNICNYILNSFEKRIRIELSLLYLSELYTNKQKKSYAVKSPKIQGVVSNDKENKQEQDI